VNSASYWGIKNPLSGGSSADATAATQATTGQVAFLVVEIQYVAGTNHSIAKLWVNPPLGKTPPATPDATITGQNMEPIGQLEFTGSRASIGDEVSVGTSWLSVTTGGSPEPY
jgi:hypothetical protein